MDQEQNRPEPAPRRRAPLLNILVGVVALAALVVAVVVVLRTAKKVTVGEPPVSLKTTPPEEHITSFRRGMTRRIATSTKRLEKHRRFAGQLSPHQDSLSRAADATIARMRADLARLDSLPNIKAKLAFTDTLRDDYDSVRARVRAFAVAVGVQEDESAESLDVELKKLISE